MSNQRALGVTASVVLLISRVLWVPISDDVASYRSELAANRGAALVGSILVVVAACLAAAVVLTTFRTQTSTRTGRSSSWALGVGEVSTVAIGAFGAWAAATSTSASITDTDVTDALDFVGAVSILSFVGLAGGLALAVSLWRGRTTSRFAGAASIALGAAQVTVGGPVRPVIILVGALAAAFLAVASLRLSTVE